MKILAITTFNRFKHLKRLLTSFERNFDEKRWQIIITDDGSTDDTIEYIENLNLEGIPITLIKNNRQGIHHQFNTIVKQLEKIEFD